MGGIAADMARLGWTGVRAWLDDINLRDNPFTIRDLRARARGLRLPLLLLVYQAAIMCVGLIAVSVYAFGGRQATPVGRAVFPSLAYLQMLLVPVVAAVLAASTVTGERERKTFDLIHITSMRGLQIALGKVAVPWFVTILTALTSLPHAVLCVIGGGITPSDVALFYVGLGLFAGVAAALGVAMSTLTRSSPTAVILSIVLYGGVGIGMWAALEVWGMFGTLGVRSAYTGFSQVSTFTALFPMGWVGGLLASGEGTCLFFGERVPFWLVGLIPWMIVATYLILVAGCRLAYSPARHLAARRAAGYASLCAAWLVFLGGAQQSLSAAPGMFKLLNGYEGGRLDLLVIASVLGTVPAAVTAALASMATPDYRLSLYARMGWGFMRPWRSFSCRSESALAFSVLVLVTPTVCLLAGFRALDGDFVPMGWPSVGLVLLPCVGVAILLVLVGAWAQTREPYDEHRRRTATGVVLGILVLWPMVVALATGIVATSLRLPWHKDAVSAAGAYLAAASPVSYPVLIGLAGSDAPAARATWMQLPGLIDLHPCTVALAAMLVLIGWFDIAARRGESRLREHWAQWNNCAKAQSE